MKPEERMQLARILSAIDVPFLIALANKGLVRRAQKDLEGAVLKIEETDDCLVVRHAEWTVWMPATGPVHARDDTRATSITRQIIAATIYLQEHWASTADLLLAAAPVAASDTIKHGAPPVAVSDTESAIIVSDAVADTAYRGCPSGAVPGTVSGAIPDIVYDATTAERIYNRLIGLTVEDLSKWAGKKVVSDLLSVMTSPLAIEVDFKVGLSIRLLDHGIEVKSLPTKASGLRLLDELLSTAPQALHKRWVVTAVIAAQKRAGKSIDSTVRQGKILMETPRSRSRILQESRSLIESMLTSGISHPSSRTIERLFTLSLSASAVHLPRLARLLRSLSTEVSHILTRDAAGDTHRLFGLMSLAYSLVVSLENSGGEPPPYLVGETRSQYDLVGDLHLVGLGCYPWRTSSGYSGFTILFWDEANQRFLSWSQSRPDSGARGFNPDLAYSTESVWSGAGTAAKLSRSAFTLRQARLNSSGRLSSTQESSVRDLKSTSLDHIDFGKRKFSDWETLRNYAMSSAPAGLNFRNPLELIVLLQPKAWDARFFDEMQQAFCWTVLDESGQPLKLVVPWNRVNERTIQFLEGFKPDLDKVYMIVARINFQTRGFLIEPLSFVSRGTRSGDYILNPAFDQKLIESKQSGLIARLRKKWTGNPVVETRLTPDDEWDAEFVDDVDADSMPIGLRNLISEAESSLLHIAESGLNRLQDKTILKFKNLSNRASLSGLNVMAALLRELATERPASGAVMICQHVCRLHKQLQVSSG